MNLVDLAPADGTGRFGRPQVMSVLALVVVAAVAGVGVAVLSDSDHAADLAAFGRWWSSALAGLTIAVVLTLVAVSVCHHVGAALSVRAAAGVPLPRLELLGLQFAASAVNRVVPAGVGAATVNGRFLVRRGGLAPGGAAAAVSAMALLGALADLIGFAVLVGSGAAFGVPGAAGEMPLLVRRLASLIPFPAGVWLWVLSGALAGLAAAACLPRWRHGTRAQRVRAAAADGAAALSRLARRPGRLVGLLAASASTTLVLSFGFALTAVLVPHGLAWRDVVALMIGYMVASAAGNAVPLPGGVGAADAAYVGVLVTAGMPAPSALAAVVAFRVVTCWAPAAVGAGAVRVLRRRDAI